MYTTATAGLRTYGATNAAVVSELHRPMNADLPSAPPAMYRARETLRVATSDSSGVCTYIAVWYARAPSESRASRHPASNTPTTNNENNQKPYTARASTHDEGSLYSYYCLWFCTCPTDWGPPTRPNVSLGFSTAIRCCPRRGATTKNVRVS